jgi:hypothetical protein
MIPETKLLSPFPTASNVDPPATPISRGFFKGSYRKNEVPFSVIKRRSNSFVGT